MFRSLRTIRSIPRLKDISFILLRHGFVQVASHLGAPFAARLTGVLRRPFRTPMSQVQRLRLAFQELGPIFIKLGQLIANRPDMFPPAMVAEFSRLEGKVDPVPFAEIRQALIEELGGDLDRHFLSIDERAVAAASIAQVHRAVLRDGTVVALKVQRPGIQKIIDRDLEILVLVAEALGRSEEFQIFDPAGLVAEVARAMERELRFSFERNALDRVRENFANDPVLVVPRTYPELCTERLLVMDWIEGVPVRALQPNRAEGRRVARECTRVLFEMIFRDGYFHADPHSSNVMVMPDGRIAFIDFGSMGLLTRELRTRLLRLVDAMLARDYHRLARQVLRVGRAREELSLFEFSQDLAVRLDPYFGLRLREVNLGELFDTIMDLARDHKVTILPGLVSMTRCLVLMEGFAQRLDPDFDTVQEITPHARRYLFDQVRPDRVLSDNLARASELASTVWEYPHYISEILRKLAKGRLHVETHVQGLEGLNERLEHSSDHVSQALIVSSLLVSSALVMGLDQGPRFLDLPLFGLLGYIAAVLWGLWILLRAGR